MTRTALLKVGAALVAIRIVIGILYLVVQIQAPGEGAMLILTDVPALALMYCASELFGWPTEIVDAYDVTFHLFGLVAWFILGLLLAALRELIRLVHTRSSV